MAIIRILKLVCCQLLEEAWEKQVTDPGQVTISLKFGLKESQKSSMSSFKGGLISCRQKVD